MGVLIVNYKTADAVGELLDSLSRDAAHERLSVSVWDNSCDDTEFELLELVVANFQSVFATVVCIRSDTNLGYARGNNAAWAALQRETSHAAPDTVVVMNPDVRLESGSIGDLAEELRDNLRCLFSAPTMTSRGLTSGQGALHRWTGQSRQLTTDSTPTEREYVYPGGHFLALTSELWHYSGGFSEDFFLYCEEADLALRLQGEITGVSIAISKTVRVAHSEGLSTARTAGDGSKSRVTYEHATRSRIILFRKHKSLRRSLIAVTTLRILWAIRVLVQGNYPEFKAILVGVCGGYRWRLRKAY
jgi:GT2 family glycosyltransferase